MKNHADPRLGERAGPSTRRLAAVVSLGVALATLALLLWSAWPAIRPAREVSVAQAVMDRAPSGVQERPEAPRVVPSVQAPGWLEAEPFGVGAAALADGVIESIHVLEGDFVERGEIVAELVREDSELRLRRAEAGVLIAQAEVDRLSAEQRAAERAFDDPVELERAVESGRAALAEAEAELRRLPSLVEAARATRTELDEVAERVRRSAERGASNEIELIVAEQRATAQRAEVESIEARRPVLEARAERLRAELRAAKRDLELRIEDRRRLDTARAALARGEAELERARAARDAATLELERMTIRAPISGYVQRRYKIPGDKVIQMMDDPESAHIVHLYDPSRLQVRVDVPLADASHIFSGQACEVVVDVLPDRAFRGEILRITHQADLQKNTLQAKVRVIDPDPILRPEMLTRVKFLPPSGSPGSTPSGLGDGSRVRVPARAISEAAGTTRVWLVTQRRSDRGVLASRPVSVVDREGEWVTVEGDLRPGSLLAVGIEEPKEGERVIVRRAAVDGGAS